MSDPLSDLIRLSGLHTMISGELRASGAWCIQLPRPEGLKFFVVTRGQAWLQLDAGAPPLRLAAGDVAVLHWHQAYLLASDLQAPRLDAYAVFKTPPGPGHMALIGDGADFHQIGGHVRLDPDRGLPLARVLPPLVHLRADAPEAPVLRWLVERLVYERAQARSGHALMTEQLTQMLVLQALRIHLARGEHLPPSALRAMTDDRLQPALRAMHAEPGRQWQVDELAALAAMSRTSFAVRFRAVAGMPPLAYLTAWRMQLARHALRHDPRPLAAWAGTLGYASESAFSHAFKRSTGLSPAQYRRQQVEGAPAPA